MLIGVTTLGVWREISVAYELSRELKKLQVRVKDVMEEEELYLKAIEKCIDEFRDIKESVEIRRDEFEALAKLRMNAYEALKEALIAQSKVEHEKSHLLESYGALIISVEQKLAELHRNQKSK